MHTHTHTHCAEREMLIMKLRAPPGPDRTEVLQLAQIFRARVVDVSDRALTLVVSGDPGKVCGLGPACGAHCAFISLFSCLCCCSVPVLIIMQHVNHVLHFSCHKCSA
jgi:hypothetical protein